MCRTECNLAPKDWERTHLSGLYGKAMTLRRPQSFSAFSSVSCTNHLLNMLHEGWPVTVKSAAQHFHAAFVSDLITQKQS